MEVEEMLLRIAICDDQRIYREDILAHCKKVLVKEEECIKVQCK